MITSPEESKASLAALVEAVDVLQQSSSANPAVRDALMSRIYAVSSRPSIEGQAFRTAQIASDEKEIDWISAMNGASLDTQSAYLLTAVAVDSGEISMDSMPVSSGFSLQSALMSARTELRFQSTLTEQVAHFESSVRAAAPSPDLDSAKALFCGSADKAITDVLDISEKTISGLTLEIAHHATELMKALEAITQLASIGDGVSGFVALAIEKFRSALAYLRGVLGPAGEARIPSLLKEFVPSFTVRGTLEKVYHVDTIREETAGLELRYDAMPKEVDEARTEVIRLVRQFERFMSGLRSVCSVMVVVAGIILIHVAAPSLPFVVPAINGLSAGVALLAGLTCLGEMQALRGIRGIRLIEESLTSFVLS